MKVVEEVEDGNQLLSRLDSLKLDIILLDISMPGPGFLELMRRLSAFGNGFRVLILSTHPEEQYALRALKSGASGYLTKNHSPEELLAAIRRIDKGGRYISQSLGEQLAKELTVAKGETDAHDGLSDREYQILCLLAGGSRSTDIAHKLSLSPKTISTYRTRIFEKMGFKNNAQLIRYAVRHDLVD